MSGRSWTPIELDTLGAGWRAGLSAETLAVQLPGRSVKAIKLQANLRGHFRSGEALSRIRREASSRRPSWLSKT